MANSVELRQERRQLWEQAKALNDRAETEKRALTAEEQEQWARMDSGLKEFDERIKRAELLEHSPAGQDEKAGPIEKPEQAPAGDSPEKRKEQLNQAFGTWLRYGMGGLRPEQRELMASRMADMPAEQRALAIGLDTAGGYLVPEDYQRRIESALLWWGGMRESGATIIRTTGGNPMPMPTDNDTGNTGELVGENAAVTEQDVTVGQRVLQAYFYSSREIRVPLGLIQDAAFDIEGWLAEKLAERIGRITNTHFTTGTGSNSPTGVTIDSAAGITAASVSAIIVDELIQLEHQVDRAYRPRARWMLHDNTMRDFRQLKDGDGRYLWQPGMTQGAPNTLFQYPYVINNDMPTMATGNRAVLFGDFSRYYIRDVVGFTLLVLRERHAENLQVAFLGFSRHDGKLIDAGGSPIRRITMA